MTNTSGRADVQSPEVPESCPNLNANSNSNAPKMIGVDSDTLIEECLAAARVVQSGSNLMLEIPFSSGETNMNVEVETNVVDSKPQRRVLKDVECPGDTIRRHGSMGAHFESDDELFRHAKWPEELKTLATTNTSLLDVWNWRLRGESPERPTAVNGEDRQTVANEKDRQTVATMNNTIDHTDSPVTRDKDKETVEELSYSYEELKDKGEALELSQNEKRSGSIVSKQVRYKEITSVVKYPRFDWDVNVVEPERREETPNLFEDYVEAPVLRCDPNVLLIPGIVIRCRQPLP
eukprot:Selendium_serpulae@DN4559_c0_g1_i1.p1